MTDNSMLDKIRKLLAKAEDRACTPAEAEIFTAKAVELIAKYGIDEALLTAVNEPLNVPGGLIVHVDTPYARDKIDLLCGVALALRCRAVTRTGGVRLTVHLFGFASDLNRVELLYTSLLVQSASALAVTPVPADVNLAAWRRSWLAGYRQAVCGRLHKAERRAEQQAQAAQTGTSAASARPSVALVLADRGDQVEQLMQRVYPKLGKARRRQLSGNGQRDGYQAGLRANLGGTGLDGSSRSAVGR